MVRWTTNWTSVERNPISKLSPSLAVNCPTSGYQVVCTKAGFNSNRTRSVLQTRPSSITTSARSDSLTVQQSYRHQTTTKTTRAAHLTSQQSRWESSVQLLTKFVKVHGHLKSRALVSKRWIKLKLHIAHTIDLSIRTQQDSSAV